VTEVDQIRSRLVPLVAELMAAMPDDQDVPTGDLADQVVGVVIHGAPRSTYHVNNAQATGDGHSSVTVSASEPDGPGRRRWRLVAGAAACGWSLAWAGC